MDSADSTPASQLLPHHTRDREGQKTSPASTASTATAPLCAASGQDSRSGSADGAAAGKYPIIRVTNHTHISEMVRQETISQLDERRPVGASSVRSLAWRGASL